MALDLPTSLSPSTVSTFTDCALAFRFSAIDRVPEAPSIPATRGTLVHRALELLFDRPGPDRHQAHALEDLDRATAEIRASGALGDLGLDPAGEDGFVAEAAELVRRYFELEDPRTITPIGLELKLEARLGDLRLRGIIDRLELDPEGRLVVTDYKTGRAPPAHVEQRRLGGVRFYAFLCEQLFGQRPARIQLLYLADPVAITHHPTAQSTRGLQIRVGAVWEAVQRACSAEDFRPRTSPLCDWCSYRAWCPAWGGDPADAPAPPPDPGGDPTPGH